ncbi:hypothetical protein TUM17568_01120 [Klebsiella oxytoca]|nr:hypothetical protein TUM17568_01120 [Klebsiella oxytoca]
MKLLPLTDIHPDQAVRQLRFFKEERDFVAIRGGCVVKIDHESPSPSQVANFSSIGELASSGRFASFWMTFADSVHLREVCKILRLAVSDIL